MVPIFDRKSHCNPPLIIHKERYPYVLQKLHFIFPKILTAGSVTLFDEKIFFAPLSKLFIIETFEMLSPSNNHRNARNTYFQYSNQHSANHNDKPFEHANMQRGNKFH